MVSGRPAAGGEPDGVRACAAVARGPTEHRRSAYTALDAYSGDRTHVLGVLSTVQASGAVGFRSSRLQVVRLVLCPRAGAANGAALYVLRLGADLPRSAAAAERQLA